MQVNCFAPVVAADCRLLILGSMPGKRSLDAQAYYAHPQNRFWPMMETLFGVAASLPYETRLQQLQAQGVGIWDVLNQCFRMGSLDSEIEEDSIIVNDFASLLLAHPHIRHICFNGAKAEQTYQRYVAGKAKLPYQPQYHRLPSTSPANASIPWANKVAAWQLLPALLKLN